MAYPPDPLSFRMGFTEHLIARGLDEPDLPEGEINRLVDEYIERMRWLVSHRSEELLVLIHDAAIAMAYHTGEEPTVIFQRLADEPDLDEAYNQVKDTLFRAVAGEEEK